MTKLIKLVINLRVRRNAKLVETAATPAAKTNHTRLDLESNLAGMTETGKSFYAASNQCHTSSTVLAEESLQDKSLINRCRNVFNGER